MHHHRTLIAGLLAILAVAAAVPTASQPVSCLAPAAIADADIARHAEALSDPVLCLTERFLEDDGVTWHFVIVANTETPGPLWAVPHDEEAEAFDAGVRAVRLHGGTMVAIENDDQRRLDGRDPNQYFARTAEAAAPCLVTGGASPAYVDAFLADWDRRFPIVGLHANWDGYLAAGGLGDISVRRPDVKMIPFPSAAAIGRLADEDTIVMLVSATLPEANERGRAAIGWFNDRGVHVIYRHVTAENYGCTLADYLTLNALAPYVSVEVEHGDPGTADILVDIVVDYLRRADFPGLL